MKNPLAVVVALILVALGALLYVSGDSWDRWRQWAQLPAEQAAVSDRTVAGQQTGDTPPEQQTAAAGVEAKAPAGVDGPPSGQSPLGEAPSGQASSGQPPAGQASSGQAPSAVASNAQQPDASATEGQSSGAPPSDTQAPAATADAQPDAGAAPQNGPTRTAETGQTSTAGATGEAAGQDAMGQGQASATEDGKPSFDIVRVEEDGTAVIAGRAAPKATVTVKLDSAQLGETQANDRGEWVLVVERPLQPGSHNLSAVAAEPGKPAVNSDQVVALALPERAEERPLIVATEPGAPAKVLQAPEPVTPVISPSGGHDLALATVDYNSRGEMIFAGKASSGAKVRLYIDNRHVADTKADAAGDWTLEHKDKIASGTHQLRLDQLNAEGKVVKRIELPFERANEALISQLLGERADEAKADAATAAAPEPQVARIEPTPPAPQPSPSAPPAQMAPRPEAPAQPSP
ncbi:hypothetical protein, partial [Rhodoligotrophos defluvii]|uniref:hypothetical protein n=1 Tax=Rhodoligotrophos defluvii TaxID=2561934 RepID=UPI0010C9DD00